MIKLEGLEHRYGETTALTCIDLEIPPGFFALLGPNGAGKTTLVGLLCTLIPLQRGRIVLGGYAVDRHPNQVRQLLGLVFQEPTLDERLTVYENLHFHALLYRVPAREIAYRIRQVLELVELVDWSNAPVHALSRGMKRRLEIGRAFLHRPKLLVLDEPTTGLDVQSRRHIWEYLHGLRQQGVSLLLTTHQLEEAEQANQVAILDQGRILAQGSPAELKERLGRPRVYLRLRDPMLAQHLMQRGGVLEGNEIRLEPPDPRAFLRDFLFRHSDQVEGMRVGLPSLEEIFLQLTGRALRG